ncbi:hypothetical protein N1851_006040 [Merluccius polli]|uniref:Ig-like domain-containing protein n=1 Tax=Merluccius polli TaxID=89951 RepID=A0AA47N4U0_MERPO|nr:hypothetical protein N1851_006040 [Merluccius polli]
MPPGHLPGEVFRTRPTERLLPPTMEVFSRLDRGSCQVHLMCSSPSPSVAFSWSIEPRTTWTEAKSIDSYYAFLSTSTKPYREARFTCNTSSPLESTSRTLVHTCNDRESIPAPPIKTETFGGGVLLGLFLGLILAVLTYILRDIEMFCSRRNLLTSSSSGDLHHEEGSLKALGWMVQ